MPAKRSVHETNDRKRTYDAFWSKAAFAPQANSPTPVQPESGRRSFSDALHTTGLVNQPSAAPSASAQPKPQPISPHRSPYVISDSEEDQRKEEVSEDPKIKRLKPVIQDHNAKTSDTTDDEVSEEYDAALELVNVFDENFGEGNCIDDAEDNNDEFVDLTADEVALEEGLADNDSLTEEDSLGPKDLTHDESFLSQSQAGSEVWIPSSYRRPPPGISQQQFDQCCLRYQSRIETAVNMLFEEVKKYGQRVAKGKHLGPIQMFNHRFWVYLEKLEPKRVIQRLVAATPPVVQWLLGQPSIDSSQLRKYAPPISRRRHHRRRGCYGDFGEHILSGLYADYIGSSGDLWTRKTTHIRKIILAKAFQDKNKSLQTPSADQPSHYRVLGKAG